MRKKYLAFAIALILCMPLSVKANEEVVLGGNSIGIEIDYDGVMVSGTYPFTINEQHYDPKNQFMAKDIIKTVGDIRVHSIDEMYKAIASYQNTINHIPVIVERNQTDTQVELTTVYDADSKSYKSGLYVKDKIVGVGTMTYYDTTNQTYGALGHEIYDVDVQQIADIHSGSIYPANVNSIVKAQPNVPGEKHANIDYNTRLGDVYQNSNIGIYGTYSIVPQHETIQIAKQQEVHTGKAMIYTVLHDSKIETFEIQITKVNVQTQSNVKGIEFTVSDERLKTLTNGIIQGMSGSPIVQDDKIIGAVTHVVTSEPCNGYGVYIEWMLQNSRKLR